MKTIVSPLTELALTWNLLLSVSLYVMAHLILSQENAITWLTRRFHEEREGISEPHSFFMSVSKGLIGTLVRAHLLMANQSLTLKEREALKARPIP